jgi:hypothetical protein
MTAELSPSEIETQDRESLARGIRRVIRDALEDAYPGHTFYAWPEANGRHLVQVEVVTVGDDIPLDDVYAIATKAAKLPAPIADLFPTSTPVRVLVGRADERPA